MPDERHQNIACKTDCFALQFNSRALITWQLISLVLLVVISGTLIVRKADLQHEKELNSQDQNQAEMITLAIGSDISEEVSGKLVNTLYRCAMVHDLSGVAVVDNSGLIVAHSNDEISGIQTELTSSPHGGHIGDASYIKEALFAGLDGRLRLNSVISSEGRIGTVAILFPPENVSSLFSGSMMFLLPAGLLILAFIGFINTTTKLAIKPVTELLDLLGQHINQNPAESTGVDPDQMTVEIENAISQIGVINKSRDSLVIENRVLNYEHRRRGVLLDNLPEGVILIDSAQKIIYCNRLATEITGVQANENNQWEISHASPEIASLLNETKKNCQSEISLNLGGNDRIFALSRHPLTSASSNELIGTLCHFRDITTQASASQTQGEFLSQISHELKAPLNTIVTFVEALADDDLLTKDERRSYSNTLNAEAQRMSRLIGNLLQLSRIQLSNFSGKFGFVQSALMIKQITDSLQAQVQSRQQTLDVRVPENLPALYGDKDLLSVAVSNLLSNALKYTPDGGTITVTAQECEAGIQIAISDTGIGIREKDRELIFERFSRTDRDEVASISGTGLGLALVKDIVETHEGQITVTSEVGQGSTFQLELPVREVGMELRDIA